MINGWERNTRKPLEEWQVYLPFCAHTVSLIGTAIGTSAIALLAEKLSEGSGPRVLGYTLTIRILVFLFLGPFAGSLSERIGRKFQMILTDVMRALVMIALFFVNAEWQLYILAFVLHLSSAFFTPIYKSIIPGVVGEALYQGLFHIALLLIMFLIFLGC